MTLISVLAQTQNTPMVLEGNSTPTRLEKISLILSGATIHFVFHFRVN